MEAVLYTALAIGCVVVLLMSATYGRHLAHLRSLRRLSPPEPAEWPLVSVVVPARNEAASVRDAIASRLADDYPALEIIFVDDRSTDGTADEASAGANGDPRFRLERITELPKGWLGKLNALARGTQLARGDWILYSDADVSVERGALRQAVAVVLAEDVDMIALIPEYSTGDFVAVVWTAFLRMLLLSLDPAKVREPGHRSAIGSGAFNLVRRSALDDSPGLEHLRLETGDDAALGQMLKESGHTIDLMDGYGCAKVSMYGSLGEYVRGVEKNGSSLAGRPPLLVIAGFALLLAVEWSPIAGLAVALSHGVGWLSAVSAVALLATTACYVSAIWRNRRAWLPGLLWPVGILLLVFGVLRSTLLAHQRGGVIWRGDFHPLSELEAGRRFTL